MTLIVQEARPIYSRRARLVDADRLIDGLNLNRQAIADEAGVHPNTLASVLAGNPVEYPNAHAVFSSLNKLWDGSHSRADHVQYFDKRTGDWLNDPELNRVRTFVRLGSITKANKIKDEIVAEKARVARGLVTILRERKPVAANVALAVFEAMLEFDKSLVLKNELIP